MRFKRMVAYGLVLLVGGFPWASVLAQEIYHPTYLITMQHGVFTQVAQAAPFEEPMKREAVEEIRRINTIRSRIGRPLLEFPLDNAVVNQDFVNQLRLIREQDELAQREWEQEQTRAATAETLRARAEQDLKRLNELRSKHGRPPLEWGFQTGEVTEETLKQITQEIENELKQEQN